MNQILIVLNPLSLLILLKYIAIITILLKQFNVLTICSVVCLENKSMQVVRLQCPYNFLKQISMQAYQNRGLNFLLVLYYCCIFVFVHCVKKLLCIQRFTWDIGCFCDRLQVVLLNGRAMFVKQLFSPKIFLLVYLLLSCLISYVANVR